MTWDEMVGWHQQFNGHEFEQAQTFEGQGSLVCCSPWGHKELDSTEQLNNNSPICLFFILLPLPEKTQSKSYY